MRETDRLRDPENEPLGMMAMPRWVLLPCGVVLGLVVLLCLAGAVLLVASPGGQAPLLSSLLGVGGIVLSLWALGKAVRLVTGRDPAAGLIGPRGLRWASWICFFLPMAGVFTGYFTSRPLVAVIQTAGWLSAFFVLRRLAVRREEEGSGRSRRPQQ